MGSGGVDCLERNQEFGSKAKHITSIVLFAKGVEVDPVTVERDGRTVAFVRLGDTLVNAELIRQGLAQIFTRYYDWAICEQWRGLEDVREGSREAAFQQPT